VEQEVVAIYFSLAIDNEIESFFLLTHETRLYPRQKAPSVVVF